MKRPLLIIVAAVGVLGTAGFALPNLPPNALTDTINDRFFQEKERSFAVVADARQERAGVLAVPSWVPADAKNVKVKVRTTDGAKLIRFTVGPDGWGGPECAGPRRPAGPPQLDAKWWPAGVGHEAEPECRDSDRYQVTVRGKRVYAWTDGETSPGTRMTATP
ncbi:hypothetical protein [Streptomyces sp. NPDC051211]|uniref:hypothetical protein n=1 Tax=Streptomyces sp. NPDC051211 TaxID=3154643 RepID=UPI00344CB81E